MVQRILIFALIALSFTASAQRRTRQQVYERSAPNVEIGRAILPGVLCLVAGSIPPDTQRARIVQQSLVFGAGISIGVWETKNRKYIFIRLGAGLVGGALGYAVRRR